MTVIETGSFVDEGRIHEAHKIVNDLLVKLVRLSPAAP